MGDPRSLLSLFRSTKHVFEAFGELNQSFLYSLNKEKVLLGCTYKNYLNKELSLYLFVFDIEYTSRGFVDTINIGKNNIQPNLCVAKVYQQCKSNMWG